MSKEKITPEELALLAMEAKTSIDLEKLYHIVKEHTHPYQLGWIQYNIQQMKHLEEQEIILHYHELENESWVCDACYLENMMEIVESFQLLPEEIYTCDACKKTIRYDEGE